LSGRVPDGGATGRVLCDRFAQQRSAAPTT
jgi:hypothetical protein